MIKNHWKITINSNLLKILKCIVEFNILSTKEVSIKTKLPYSTTFENLQKLEIMEEIKSERRKVYTGKGRPKTYWKLN